MTIAHKWQPITDLPAEPRSLTDAELDSLQRVWQAQKDHLIERTTLEEFDKRLRREWAIETGIIENVYTLDRGVTQTLIEKGINAALIPHDAGAQDSTLVARLIQDHYDVLEGMFDFVAGRRQLSTSYVKEFHSGLLRNVDVHFVVDQSGRAFEKRLEKGVYKTSPNSPTRPDGSLHEYCPPEQLASEMDALIRMHLAHDSLKIPPEVEATWLHHRFTQIHPFADGNGRVARAISSLVFIKADWFPLIIKREDKTRYIEALEKADEGELQPLVSLFVEGQRNVLIQATEVAYDVHPITSAHEAVLAARDRLLQRRRLPLNEWLGAENVATQLFNLSRKRLEEVAVELRAEVGGLGKGFVFEAVGAEQFGWQYMNETVLRKAGQIPDPAGYHGAAQLNLQTGATASLVISFHAIGPRFHGLIGVVPYLRTQGAEPSLINGATFQINYEEDLASATTRFSSWLDGVIVKGLNMWRLTL